MSRAKTLGLAGVAALLSTASLAADLPPLPPPVYRAPVVETTGGWYLRGFIGASNEFLKEISHLDLGTWWCFTPFIGAGAGFASIKIDHFRDVNVIASGGGFADTGTQTNFAWALHAGAAYKVNPNFAVELSYRYLNVGNAQSGTL